MSWILLLAACSTTTYVPPSDDDQDDPSDTEVVSTETETDSESSSDDVPTETESDSDDVPTETDTEEPGEAWPLISEVCDHADYGNVKYVEIYNPGSVPVDLSDYVLERYSNGGTEPGQVSLSGLLSPGDTYVIVNAGGESDFEGVFGASADLYDGNVNGNGNDAYALSLYGSTIIDIYGQIGVDGEGTSWEYTDSVATRKAVVTEPSSTWIAGEWVIDAGGDSASPFERE